MEVELRIEGRRADVVLNRPEVLNAMNFELFDALAEVTARLRDNTDVRVVVVSGEGRSFSSGIDTTTFGGPMPAGDLIARAQAGIRNIAELQVPTVAKVRGHAFGAGFQVALACDLRVVTADARIGLFEARYGLIPDLGGTHRLTELAGPALAKQMMWLSEEIDGNEAKARGLAERVVEPDELDEAIDDLAAGLAAAPPLVVQGIKRLVTSAPHSTFEQALDDVAIAQEKIMGSSDFGEAIAAFMQKRDPDFKGE